MYTLLQTQLWLAVIGALFLSFYTTYNRIVGLVGAVFPCLDLVFSGLVGCGSLGLLTGCGIVLLVCTLWSRLTLALSGGGRRVCLQLLS